MLQLLWKFIVVGVMTGFGAASFDVEGRPASPDGTRVTAPPCRMAWQRQWDAHACTRQSHRCPADARIARTIMLMPCGQK
jgi:hypothetical protein